MTTPAPRTARSGSTSRVSHPPAAPVPAVPPGRLSSGRPHHATPTATPTTSARTIRVLCVDDHEVLVEGLKAQFTLDGRIAVVGWLPTADRLLEEVARLAPDVVLLDIEMPGSDAFEMADRIHHLHPEVRILVLSAHVRDSYLSAAYRCGASGYFAKSDDLAEIVEGVRHAGSHPTATFVMGTKVRERCLSLGTAGSPPTVASQARTADADHPPATRLEALSARELEVLRLIGRGLSRTEIATQLSRSVKTVDGHQDRIMHKLDITSRADLMRFAIREGLAEA